MCAAGYFDYGSCCGSVHGLRADSELFRHVRSVNVENDKLMK